MSQAGPNKPDWKARIERAQKAQRQREEREGQKNAQAHGDGSEATQQPKAQAKGTSNNTAGPKDQSIADLRMEAFQGSHNKLSSNKSQLPNLAIQSRIFPPTKKGRRSVFDWKYIESDRGDVEIWQRGEQLNQLDLTGWLMLIRFAKGSDLIAEFTRYEFLRAMRKHDSSRDYKWLRALLSRLGFSQFNIYLHDNGEKWVRYEGPLAPQNYETENAKFAVQLSKPLYALFGFDGWSFIDMNQRLALGQNQWAQAFHAYLTTHTCPNSGFWWNKHELWKQWGAGYNSLENFMRHFRQRVVKSLYDIQFLQKVVDKKTAIGFWW